jgi:pectate lyase
MENPNKKSSNIATLNAGHPVYILEITEDNEGVAWYKIRSQYYDYDNIEGYIPGEFLEPVEVWWNLAERNAPKSETTVDSLSGFTTITVNTPKDFLEALGSNRKIILQAGVYNLSSLSPWYKDDTGKPIADVQNINIYWEEVNDGSQINLTDITNLTIEGAGINLTELVVTPRDAFVLNFINCSGITIKNLTAGHTEDGECVGGVFGFTNTGNISIENTDMYGCGTVGLELVKVNNLTVKNSIIRECTYHIMTIDDSYDILFQDCHFHNNQEFNMVGIHGSSNITIDNCKFENNRESPYNEHFKGSMFSIEGGNNITVKNSQFINNQVTTFVTSNCPTLILLNNTFQDNKFDNLK